MQGDEFRLFTEHLMPRGVSSSEVHYNIPFFDPPLVSPHGSALAVPLSLYAIWACFAEVN